MNAQVEAVHECALGRCEVTFRAGSWRWRAGWASESDPLVNRTYSVEFDIADSIELGRNATPFEPGRCELSVADDIVTIRGEVEAVDEAVVYLRLSNDCLMMIESQGDRLRAGSWVCLRVTVNDLTMYAQG